MRLSIAIMLCVLLSGCGDVNHVEKIKHIDLGQAEENERKEKLLSQEAEQAKVSNCQMMWMAMLKSCGVFLDAIHETNKLDHVCQQLRFI